MGEVIAVLSGKGGTGKTSLCAGISTALAQTGEKILCIDCDIGLRNLDISLGMTDSGSLSFMDVCRGHYDLTQAPHHLQFPQLQFLTAPMNCAAADIDTHAFAALLRTARGQFDYIFLDAPAGIEAGFQLCAQHADRMILVTNADPASVRDATRAGQLLELMGKDRVRIVVNRINEKMLDTVKVTIDDIMDQAGLPLLGYVPDDGNVTLAASFGKPLLKYTKKGAAAACARIARRIQGLSVPIR